MFWFWTITILIAGAVAAWLARAILRAKSPVEETHPDLHVYRAQLAEVERDLARGTLTEAEADAIRTEVSRRLLEADRRRPRGGDTAPGWLGGAAAGGIVLLLVVGAFGLYARLGSPGYPDLPLAQRIEQAETIRRTRPSQAELETEVAALPPSLPTALPEETEELLARLRTVVAERPDDLRGQSFLARGEAAAGNFVAAHRAQARVVDLKGEEATAEDYARLADLLVMAAGGYVSPEAEMVLRQALSRDPTHGSARYYSGLLAAQTGRPDIAFRIWRSLLENGPPDAPWVEPIRAEIELYARLAGVEYTLPAVPGPSAADVAAAGDMSPEARDEMIRGMVGGLAERLASQGGPPAEWARLIRAYGVLGESERARSIWEEAQRVFPEDALAPVRKAAAAAGVAD